MATVRVTRQRVVSARSDDGLTLAWIILGVALLLVLGLVGLVMRSTQAGILPLTSWFYPLLTLHGTGMVALGLVMMMALSRYLLAPSLGLSTRLMIWAFGATLLAVVLLLAATLVGGFGAGWTFLYPLPYRGGWDPWAFVAFLLAVTIAVVMFLVVALEFLWRGVLTYGSLGRMYGLEHLFGERESGDRRRTDPQTVAMTVVALTWMPGALAGAVLVVLELVQVVVPTFSFSPLLAKNLLFFAGHMLVNIQIYMGAAIVYALLPVYTRRPWPMSPYLVLGWLVTTLAVMIAFFHHLYMDFAQPLAVQVLGELASYIVAFPPVVVTIFGAVLLVWRSGIRWSPAPLFLYAGLVGWAIGGAAAVVDGTIGVNQVMHNTTWVPAHFHTYMALGLVLFFLGAMYHLLPAVAGGRQLSDRLGRWASAFVIVGGYTLVGSWYLAGILSEPRRYAVQLQGTEWVSLLGSLGGLVMGIGALLIGIDLVRTLLQSPGPVAIRQPSLEPAPG